MRVWRQIVVFVCVCVCVCVGSLKQNAVVEKLVELVMKILFRLSSENNVNLRN